MSDIFGQVFNSSGSGSIDTTPDQGINQNPGLTTPQQYSTPDDERKGQQAGQYPNYWSYKPRDGNSIMTDSSPGNESITFQGRGGSMLQFMANGAVNRVTNHGEYHAVFGEKRATITGAHDLTVKGDSSQLVYGDYNMNLPQSNFNLSQHGDWNHTAQNHNSIIRGNHSLQAVNGTHKYSGNTVHQVMGSRSDTTSGDHSIASKGGLFFGSKNGTNFQSKGGLYFSGSSIGFDSDVNHTKTTYLSVLHVDQIICNKVIAGEGHIGTNYVNDAHAQVRHGPIPDGSPTAPTQQQPTAPQASANKTIGSSGTGTESAGSSAGLA